MKFSCFVGATCYVWDRWRWSDVRPVRCIWLGEAYSKLMSCRNVYRRYKDSEEYSLRYFAVHYLRSLSLQTFYNKITGKKTSQESSVACHPPMGLISVAARSFLLPKTDAWLLFLSRENRIRNWWKHMIYSPFFIRCSCSSSLYVYSFVRLFL